MRVAGFVICLLSFTLPAAARLNSAALRAKFGAPLNRETFHISSGFDLIVDYGSIQQVCRIEMPARVPDKEAFLAGLLPAEVRGKEVLRMQQSMGAVSMSSVEYENLTISGGHSDDDRQRDTLTVIFKTEDCQNAMRRN